MATAKEEREAAARGEGCLGKAADDEPVFVLRAQDYIAPWAVKSWVSHALATNRVPSAKIEEAMRLCDQMRKWQKTHGCKAPD